MRSEVDRLRDEVENLREIIRQMKERVAPPDLIFPAAWDLPQAQTVILRALISRPILTEGDTLLLGYVSVSGKSLTTQLSHLRNSFRANKVDVKIINDHGVGWRLSAEGKKTLIEICRAEVENLSVDEALRNLSVQYKEQVDRLVAKIDTLTTVYLDLNRNLKRAVQRRKTKSLRLNNSATSIQSIMRI